MPYSRERIQARKQPQHNHNIVDSALKGALGTTVAALLLISATQIPYNQERNPNSVIPSTTPDIETPIVYTSTSTSTSTSTLTPIGELLAQYLEPGHPFRERALDEYYLKGSATTLESCKTGDGEEASGIVNVKRLNVRSLPSISVPILSQHEQKNTVKWRIQALLTHWSKGVIERWIGIENNRGLNFAAAKYGGEEYIKNDLYTKCEPIQIPDLVLR